MAQTVSLTTVQDVISRAVARWSAHRGRIERAGSLIILGHVTQTGPETYAVRSQRDDDVTYAVTTESCPCVDQQRHPGQPCKHRWAVRLLEIAEERQRVLDARESEQAKRAAVTADRVALAYAKAIGWAA